MVMMDQTLEECCDTCNMWFDLDWEGRSYLVEDSDVTVYACGRCSE